MKMMTDDPALALAQHVCRTSYADLPASAVESARRDILDTFGCMLGGEEAKQHKRVVEKAPMPAPNPRVGSVPQPA